MSTSRMIGAIGHAADIAGNRTERRADDDGDDDTAIGSESARRARCGTARRDQARRCRANARRWAGLQAPATISSGSRTATDWRKTVMSQNRMTTVPITRALSARAAV